VRTTNDARWPGCSVTVNGAWAVLFAGRWMIDPSANRYEQPGKPTVEQVPGPRLLK
jgi:hypothetical protein